jgi:hypothetical protein
MESGAQSSLFTLSIDLELDIDQQNESLRQRLDDLRSELILLLDQHQLPATWAVADPAISASTEPILASPIGHELAVLADRSWFGAGSGRLRLRRELSRRFDRARRAGISLSTLALRNVDEVTEVDLLVEQGIVAIRGPAVSPDETSRPVRSSSRADIWHLPAAWQLPMQSAWWLPSNWSIKRRIRQALRNQSAVHVAIDSPLIVEDDTSSLEGLGELFAWISALSAAGQLQVSTLGRLGKQFVSQHAATPSRSILRPAA